MSCGVYFGFANVSARAGLSVCFECLCWPRLPTCGCLADECALAPSHVAGTSLWSTRLGMDIGLRTLQWQRTSLVRRLHCLVLSPFPTPLQCSSARWRRLFGGCSWCVDRSQGSARSFQPSVGHYWH